MTMQVTPVLAFHARLADEHERIDAALDRLIEAFETDDWEAARTAFREFDSLLAAHLELEDRVLLPHFAQVDQLEAERLRDEHRAIRAMVDELVIGSDLHLTTLPAVRQLAATLREHVRREDAGLYRWIDHAYGDRSASVPSEQPAQPPAM